MILLTSSLHTVAAHVTWAGPLLGVPTLSTLSHQHQHIYQHMQRLLTLPNIGDTQPTPQSTEGPYLDHGETTNEPIEKVYETTLVTTMGLFKYVDGGNSKITPKK